MKNESYEKRYFVKSITSGNLIEVFHVRTGHDRETISLPRKLMGRPYVLMGHIYKGISGQWISFDWHHPSEIIVKQEGES